MSQQPAKAEQRSVTHQRISEECGVSKSTVQRVLGGDGRLVAPETAETIRAVAARLGYNPSYHEAARRMAYHRHGKRAQSKTVVLFLPLQPNLFSTTQYYYAVFQGIIDVLASQHYDIVTRFIRAAGDDCSTLPSCVLRGEVDAAIILPPEGALPFLAERLLQEPAFHSRPVVCMLQPSPGCSCVMADDTAGGYLAASHLLELGHRAILHCHPFHIQQRSFHAAQRVAGYHQACLERQLDPDRVFHAVEIDYTLPPAERYTRALEPVLAPGSVITAIMAQNDPVALAFAEILEQHGKHVPADMSLIGFDDTEVLPDVQGKNMLTTLHVPLEQIGREVAQLAIRLSTEESGNPVQIVLPTTLALRGTTAPASAAPYRPAIEQVLHKNPRTGAGGFTDIADKDDARQAK